MAGQGNYITRGLGLHRARRAVHQPGHEMRSRRMWDKRRRMPTTCRVTVVGSYAAWCIALATMRTGLAVCSAHVVSYSPP